MDALDILDYVYGGQDHHRSFQEMNDHFGPSNTSNLLKILEEKTNRINRPWFESNGKIYATTNHAPIADLKRFKK